MIRTICLVWFFAFFLFSCQITAPTVSDVQDARLVSGKNGKFGVEVDLQINNPNKHAIILKKIRLDVLMNGSKIGTAKNSGKVKIDPMTTRVYSIPLDLKADQVAGLGFGLLNTVLGGSANIEVKGFGVARVGILSSKFPIEESQSIR